MGIFQNIHFTYTSLNSAHKLQPVKWKVLPVPSDEEIASKFNDLMKTGWLCELYKRAGKLYCDCVWSNVHRDGQKVLFFLHVS